MIAAPEFADGSFGEILWRIESGYGWPSPNRIASDVTGVSMAASSMTRAINQSRTAINELAGVSADMSNEFKSFSI
ncbi:MAG: hypothetical protein ABI382_03220 [Nakamurella sp.]